MPNTKNTSPWNEAIETAKYSLSRQREDVWLSAELGNQRSVKSVMEIVEVLTRGIGKLDAIKEDFGCLTRLDGPATASVDTPGNPPILDVGNVFSDCDPTSLNLTQRLVNEVCGLKDPHGNPIQPKLRNGKNALGFSMNFVEIEGIRKRQPGVQVCVYGKPANYPGAAELKTRRRVFSGKILRSQEDVEAFLPVLHKAYELKLGRFRDNAA